MDDTARSFLVDLMTRSKKGLSFAEQLCSQAREELDACQGHSDEIEKIYSKLCFLSHQIKIQIAAVESFLRIARSRLNELSTASKDLHRDLKGVSQRMEYALRALRSNEVDPEIQKTVRLDEHGQRTMTGEESSHAVVLFDFLDEVSLNQLQQESSERMQRIQSTTSRLRNLVEMLSQLRTEFKGYLTNAITLDDSALSFAREKMHLQEQQTTSMAVSLVSLANHYDQVAQFLIDDIQLADEDLNVLESDTTEVPVIIEELEESLALVQATSEEIGVREHLYTTAYREAVAQFGNINQLEPQLAELMDVFRSAEGLREDFDSTEKLIGEINSLAIWYEEFHNSYGALTVEIVRRHQAHQAQERLVRDFMDRMESLQNDEIHRRAVFSERHGKYLPVDLCPSIADFPPQYEVMTHGEWTLPMPTRATLQLVEGHNRNGGK